MNLDALPVGYLPLIDAAPLIVAKEIGFAAEEGLSLDLIRMSSWAQSRDQLGMGAVKAAHMLAPMPIAQTLGLGPRYPRFDLTMILSQGGQVVAVSAELERKMRGAGYAFDFHDPFAARSALLAASGGRLRVATPFPFSTQAELVSRWLAGAEQAIEIRTIPPPMMAEAVAAGEADAFCVGEPWASYAVEAGVAALLLPGRAIWAAPPEKGLVLLRDFAEGQPELTGRLMRSLWRAGRWLDAPDNRSVAAEILSRPDYLNLPPELSERGLMGRLHVSSSGEVRPYPDFIRFHEGGASFPWRSLAALLAQRIARLNGLDEARAMVEAMSCFRSDLYRSHLREAGADLPGASAKLEGAMTHPTPVASEKGRTILGPDAFFDGWTFDPPLFKP